MNHEKEKKSILNILILSAVVLVKVQKVKMTLMPSKRETITFNIASWNEKD